MNIVGISGLHNSASFKAKEFPQLSPRCHKIGQGLDSAAALVTDNGIVAAAAEERFTRIKGTGSFPVNAIRFCLESANLTPNMVDVIAHSFDFEPLRPFFEQSDPFFQRKYREVFSQEAQLRCLEEYLPAFDWSDRFVSVPHHLAHAASAFYPSGFKDSLVLVADAVGEMHGMTISIANGDGISIIKQIPALHSLGILYSVFTFFLGFTMACDEYKVMGLAPYGNSRRYFGRVMGLINLSRDGGYTIPILSSNRTIEEKETYSGTIQAITEYFGLPREPGSHITRDHMDLAAALQDALQATVMHVLQYFKRETGQNNLCMAGGVALNCTLNSVIRRSRVFKNIFVQPAAGDDGSALGAALYVQGIRQPSACVKKMNVPLWGPSYSTQTIQQTLSDRGGCDSVVPHSFEELAANVAQRIAHGQVVAWFQDRMEFGPRALGNRSILADPRRIKIRDHLNNIVKQRESFRPFAPAVAAEASAEIFDLGGTGEVSDSCMLFVAQVQATFRDRLPAITHIDGSARLQVVSKEDNYRFWTLLHLFGEIAEMPVLLNTSLNLHNQPIACSPEDAIDLFLTSDIDVLVIGDYLVTRRV